MLNQILQVLPGPNKPLDKFEKNIKVFPCLNFTQVRFEYVLNSNHLCPNYKF